MEERNYFEKIFLSSKWTIWKGTH